MLIFIRFKSVKVFKTFNFGENLYKKLELMYGLNHTFY